SNTCPVDLFALPTTVCRSAAGTCDVAENCTGLSSTCPPDVFLPNGTSCNDSNSCTGPDTCQGGVCTGVPDPASCTDHALCYKAKASPFTAIPNVHLVDQFEDVMVNVVKPKQICTPADKAGEGIIDAATHFKAYQFKQLVRHVRR